MFEKLIKWFAKDLIQKTEERAAVSGYNLRNREIEDNRRIDLEFSMKEAIGKKIIYCPNEWSDPLFAIVTGITYITLSQQPVLACKDVITGENSIVYPGSFYYADELLTLTILKLNPFERWNMSVGKLSHMSNMWNKWYPPKESITDSIVLEDKLREVGFLFKDKSTSDWMVESVKTFSYHKYEFFVSKEPTVNKIRYKLKGNVSRVKSFTFSSKEEMKEFKQILGF